MVVAAAAPITVVAGGAGPVRVGHNGDAIGLSAPIEQPRDRLARAGALNELEGRTSDGCQPFFSSWASITRIPLGPRT